VTSPAEHWWLLDLRISGVIVTHVLILGRTLHYRASPDAAGYELRVGDDAILTNNFSCEGVFDIRNGREA